jgi:hypothetical protein
MIGALHAAERDMHNRHAFQILEQLGSEADRLGVKVVDAYGQSGPVSEFLPKIIRYIEAREAEIDRLRITDEEREAIAEAVGAYNDNDDDEECARIAATLHGLLKRTERRS